jgi:hypothetical protein
MMVANRPMETVLARRLITLEDREKGTILGPTHLDQNPTSPPPLPLHAAAMKRKQTDPAAAAEADEPAQPSLPLDSFSGDVCAALAARYGRSAAPQHRHLLASAAAIQSILLDDSGGPLLPLTPASYVPAAVSALRAAGSAADADAASPP